MKRSNYLVTPMSLKKGNGAARGRYLKMRDDIQKYTSDVRLINPKTGEVTIIPKGTIRIEPTLYEEITTDQRYLGETNVI